MICDYCCKSYPEGVRVKWGGNTYFNYYCHRCFPEVLSDSKSIPWYDGYEMWPITKEEDSK